MATHRMQQSAQVGFWRIELGDFLITVVSDGTATLDTRQILIDVPEERINELMALNYCTPRTQLSVNTLLVDTGSQVVLIDTGAGDLFKPEGGLLPQNLRLAGYDPNSIDHVVLSHIHADHSGGLILDGAMVFPSAEVHVPADDFRLFMDPEAASSAQKRYAHVFQQARACLGPYVDSGQSRLFDWGREVLPGIMSRAAGGHTPGHSHLVIESAGQKLVFLGDTIHVGEVQFACPCAAVTFDIDPEAAKRDRRRALEDAAREGYWVGFSHVSFPGIGHIRREGKSFGWVPIPYLLIGKTNGSLT